MSEITRVTVEPLDLALHHPFEIALGTQTSASNVLVTVETDAGITGYGEAAPTPHVTGETQSNSIATIRSVATLLEGRDVRRHRELNADLHAAIPGAVATLYALETAILDAHCRELEIPLAALFGGVPDPIETDMTIPIVSAAAAQERASAAVDRGFESLKIKTGTDLEQDIERVCAVAEAAPAAALKVDANQGWTPKETVRFDSRLRDRGVPLELIEQPVARDDVDGLQWLTNRVSTPIAADETVFTPSDATRIVRERAADVLNIKLIKSGICGGASIATIADSASLECMVGCMLESSIGIHTSAHLVSALGTFEYVDLDSVHLLADDVVSASSDGPMIEPSGPGHGITPES
ncbi:dipeptide epimerase [Natrononativus amylolyticus]|uniref:dipeptide epimerase n=1 Tax=Natrononativus amylolyticus TaxID=2963434 RepID=UPI0020CCAEFF|nr:dipeptide epimerase [Natrononativus amylolyticus]